MNTEAIKFVERIIASLNEEIKYAVSRKDKNSYSEWFRSYFSDIVRAEKLVGYWEYVLTALNNPLIKEEDMLDYLKGIRNHQIKELLLSRVSNSTNPISNEIESIRQDAIKEFVGLTVNDTKSMVDLMVGYFGANPKDL